MCKVSSDREWLDALAMSVRKDAALTYTLDQIVEHAKLATAADEVGIHLRRRGGRVEAAESSNHPSHEADQLQIDLDEGPCLDAAVNGPEVVRINDLRTEPRWPRWSQTAADLGWRSVLSVTLATESDVIGSLNLYSRTAHRYDRADEDVAVLFARHATAALAPALKIEGLRKALDSRLIIGRAEGVLMERYGLSGDEAFAMLQRQSNNTNQKLIDIARTILND
jgi:GAF domain-containing protein